MEILDDVQKRSHLNLCASDFTAWESTCQIRKMINQTFGAIVDSSAEYCRKI